MVERCGTVLFGSFVGCKGCKRCEEVCMEGALKIIEEKKGSAKIKFITSPQKHQTYEAKENVGDRGINEIGAWFDVWDRRDNRDNNSE